MKSASAIMLFLNIFFAAPLSYSAGEFTVATIAHLTFGKIAALGSGSVTVNPSGTRSSAGAVSLLTSGGGSSARFQISGEAKRAFMLTLPSDGEVQLISESHSLSVTQFTTSSSTFGSLNASGLETLSLGATLNIDSQKPAGEYSGTFSFTIDYQ